jgi:photosystem II stability/assembly factor-like uncharacterized protein
LRRDVGWAANGRGIYWTDDGGISWRAITPPNLVGDDPIARISDLRLVGSNTLLLSAQARNAASEQVERSANGGKTWVSIPLKDCPNCGTAYLAVLNSRTAYALAGSELGGHLYKTANGGETWTGVSSTRFAGLIEFVSGRRGFAVSEPRWGGNGSSKPMDGGILYRTADGGKSWVRTALPANHPNAATVGVPHFFSRREGVVPVLLREPSSRAKRIQVYVTKTSGVNWKPTGKPVSLGSTVVQSGVPDALPFSAASATTWIVARGADLHITRNAGRNWIVRPAHGLRTARISNLSFISDVAGWALLTTPSTGSRLARTSDGGRTWAFIAVP